MHPHRLRLARLRDSVGEREQVNLCDDILEYMDKLEEEILVLRAELRSVKQGRSQLSRQHDRLKAEYEVAKFALGSLSHQVEVKGMWIDWIDGKPVLKGGEDE